MQGVPLPGRTVRLSMAGAAKSRLRPPPDPMAKGFDVALPTDTHGTVIVDMTPAILQAAESGPLKVSWELAGHPKAKGVVTFPRHSKDPKPRPLKLGVLKHTVGKGLFTVHHTLGGTRSPNVLRELLACARPMDLRLSVDGDETIAAFLGESSTSVRPLPLGRSVSVPCDGSRPVVVLLVQRSLKAAEVDIAVEPHAPGPNRKAGGREAARTAPPSSPAGSRTVPTSGRAARPPAR